MVFVASITVVYAALSASLSINGSAEVQESRWKFRLDEGMSLSGKDHETTGTGVYNKPTYQGMTTSYQISLSKPGDSVTYYLRIYNEGTLKGEIESIVNANPICTSSTNNSEDANLVCNNLIYEITYSDGTAIQAGDVIGVSSSSYTAPDTCLKGSSKGTIRSIKLKITFDENTTSVPSSTITISNLKTTINLKQTDKICENDGAVQEPTMSTEG